jgi:putative flippase GtrA
MTLKKGSSFLFVGFINTAFGYLVALSTYVILREALWLPLILLIINVINVSFSFLTYKVIVFKTKGNWFYEYLRCYLVYGINAIVSILMVWYLIDILDFKFWLAQGVAVFLGVFLSFGLHDKFTFADKNKR